MLYIYIYMLLYYIFFILYFIYLGPNLIKISYFTVFFRIFILPIYRTAAYYVSMNPLHCWFSDGSHSRCICTEPVPCKDHGIKLPLHLIRHRVTLGLVVVQFLDAPLVKAAVPHHHGVGRQHLRLEFRQHIDEAIDRVGRLTGRRV